MKIDPNTKILEPNAVTLIDPENNIVPAKAFDSVYITGAYYEPENNKIIIVVDK